VLSAESPYGDGHERRRVSRWACAVHWVLVSADPRQRDSVWAMAYFDRAGTSNGLTEAINGRLEHLRGSALGFRNLANYIARSLLETGGFRPHLHLQIG
jgi:transposase